MAEVATEAYSTYEGTLRGKRILCVANVPESTRIITLAPAWERIHSDYYCRPGVGES